MEINRLAIFCGSSLPVDEKLTKDIHQFLSELFSTRDFEVIYGGANIGLMGVVADLAVSFDRKVHGVMPTFLKEKGVAHPNLTSFIDCETMHLRKSKMYDMAEAFLILPGGFGTLDELFEILTWRQLSQHNKKIFLLNCNGFYNHLVHHLINMAQMGFISAQDRDLVKVISSAGELD